MDFYYYPGAQLLLLDESEEVVQMRYNNNPYTWPMTLIGDRSPYYTNPRYEEEYPTI